MKVSDVHALVPLASVYEFRRDAKYIICFERRTADPKTIEGVVKALAAPGISALGMFTDADPKIFALDETVIESNGHKSSLVINEA